MSANDTQVGGDHYKTGDGKPQHWDMVRQFELDYFQGQITKYLFRHAKKNGKQDLEKAMHYLQKYMEVEYPDKKPEQITLFDLKLDQAKKITDAFDADRNSAAGSIDTSERPPGVRLCPDTFSALAKDEDSGK